jgi:hypothetical protein
MILTLTNPIFPVSDWQYSSSSDGLKRIKRIDIQGASAVSDRIRISQTDDNPISFTKRRGSYLHSSKNSYNFEWSFQNNMIITRKSL